MTYRAQSGAMAVGIAVAALLGFVGFEWAGVAGMTSVRLQCNRHVGECTLMSSPSFGGPRSVPLASIQRAELVETGTGKARSYSVVFLTDAGVIPLSGRGSSSRPQRAPARTDIDRFLADKRQDTLEVDYDSPVTGSIGFTLFGFVWLYALFIIAASARVEVDPEKGTVTVIRLRGQVPMGREVFRLTDVTDAIVLHRPGNKGTEMYRVALLVAGKEVSLLAWGSSNQRWHEQAAGDLRALLARSRPG
jgi:hypothetical protein